MGDLRTFQACKLSSRPVGPWVDLGPQRDLGRAGEWKIVETDFAPPPLGKVETNFALGNGYMGLRSATEEKYLSETRDL